MAGDLTVERLQEIIAAAVNAAVAPLHEPKVRALSTRVPNPSPRTHEQPKLAKPSEFTGAKDSVDIETFLSQVTLNLAPYGRIPDVQRVRYLLSHFKGAAGKWVQVYIKRMDEGEFFTYDAMVEKINKMWGLVDKEGQAVRELEALRQGTSSVTDYIATFRQKAQYTQFSDYDLRL